MAVRLEGIAPVEIKSEREEAEGRAGVEACEARMTPHVVGRLRARRAAIEAAIEWGPRGPGKEDLVRVPPQEGECVPGFVSVQIPHASCLNPRHATVRLRLNSRLANHLHIRIGA